jgi:hypothetical protein
LQLEFDFAVVISTIVNTADSRKVMQRPIVPQQVSGGGFWKESFTAIIDLGALIRAVN